MNMTVKVHDTNDPLMMTMKPAKPFSEHPQGDSDLSEEYEDADSPNELVSIEGNIKNSVHITPTQQTLSVLQDKNWKTPSKVKN